MNSLNKYQIKCEVNLSASTWLLWVLLLLFAVVFESSVLNYCCKYGQLIGKIYRFLLIYDVCFYLYNLELYLKYYYGSNFKNRVLRIWSIYYYYPLTSWLLSEGGLF